MTTEVATAVSENNATFNGSYTSVVGAVTEAGFEYGTTTALGSQIVCQTVQSLFGINVSGLSEGTQYYYRAYVLVDGQKFMGQTVSFRTRGGGSSQGGFKYSGCMEMPAVSDQTPYKIITEEFDFNTQTYRNYTVLYDPDKYAAYWAAYPMHSFYMLKNTERTGKWVYSTYIDKYCQIGSYGDDSYNRGHQIASADRYVTREANVQTFKLTNITPQLVEFNSPKWADLENYVRGQTSRCDTLYVVTGATFDGNKYISGVNGYSQTKSDIPVPDKYYKALLKCNFDNNGAVTNAIGIGFIMNHSLSAPGYAQSVYSISQVEEATGFEFFTNLPAGFADAKENKVLKAFADFTSGS